MKPCGQTCFIKKNGVSEPQCPDDCRLLYIRYHESVPDGAIDKCLNDLATADDMETMQCLEDDDAMIDDPMYVSRLLTLRQETLIRDDTVYFDRSPREIITP
ncbi:hypothetical protein MTO96_035501 [Rhipicephalus appendiculatus]